MKLLKCKLCNGETDLVGNERTVERKVKCRKCGFTNANAEKTSGPEVIVIRRRPSEGDGGSI